MYMCSVLNFQLIFFKLQVYVWERNKEEEAFVWVANSCSSCATKCGFQSRERTRRNQSAISYIQHGIPFQKTSFISLGEINHEMFFELMETQDCTSGGRIQFEGQAKLREQESLLLHISILLIFFKEGGGTQEKLPGNQPKGLETLNKLVPLSFIFSFAK